MEQNNEWNTFDMVLRCFNPKYQPKQKESKYEQNQADGGSQVR